MPETLFLENPWLLLAIILWTLPWKGLALWKAARNSHKKWFTALLVFNTLAVLEMVYIFFFGRDGKAVQGAQGKAIEETKDAQDKKKINVNDISSLEAANRKRRADKEKAKEIILSALRKNKKMTNDDVQELLKVSDATATNYLQELEEEDRIKQIGKTGKHVFYRFNR